MKIGFIGAGKVGFSLGRYFAEKGMELSGYYSRDPESSKAAAEFTSSARYTEASGLIGDSDAIFLTVPDGEINRVYSEIKTAGIAGKQLCHCSGAMTAADAFPDISEYSARGLSIHPLFPVSSRYESYKQLGDAFFCIEGDEAVAAEWTEIFAGLGNRTRIISPESKKRYHAACAVSSNLVCGLVSMSLSLLRSCGFSDEEALCALKPLAESNIRNIFSQGLTDALTGAVERCDIRTVEEHIRCIDSEEDRQIYKALSLKLTELAEIKHPETDYSGMYRILR
ncbi:MAG: DUF2520 domain-containing protein [Ruminococcus sp.]|nr:DUF2520 domain-containing protein [Ruminococcus sp.]